MQDLCIATSRRKGITTKGEGVKNIMLKHCKKEYMMINFTIVLWKIKGKRENNKTLSRVWKEDSCNQKQRRTRDRKILFPCMS